MDFIPILGRNGNELPKRMSSDLENQRSADLNLY